MIYTLKATLLVTSDDSLQSNEEEFTLEFDALDEDRALRIAHDLLDDLQVPYGVDALVEDGWIDPVIEETLQADLYTSARRIADLCT